MSNETKMTYSELIIMAMPEDGYVVRIGERHSQSFQIPTALFAASTKREALDFINERLSK